MSNIEIAVAKGDGIGPEIMDAVLGIFKAAKVPLAYHTIEMGKAFYDKGFSTGMSPEAKETVERLGILFKGPMETPKGKGVKSINVTARKVWSTYANRRHFRTLQGVDTIYSKAGIPIDLTIVRENIEDTYGGIEHMLTNDVALCRRFITRTGSLQVCRFAFEMARREGFKKVACGHKANIMKLTDGLFLECFYEVAKDYPEIQAYDVIVDDLCMKLTTRPNEFQVVVLPNLQGDIVSDLCAGLVGGLGFAPSANIGDNISIFEAVHGTAPDIAGKNIANPTSLLLSGVMMLRHLGLYSYAETISNALFYTLEQGEHTGDFGDKLIPSSSTSEFAEIIIGNLGKKPKKHPSHIAPEDVQAYKLPKSPSEFHVMASGKEAKDELIGVDIFLESEAQPAVIAGTVKSFLKDNMQLVMISNRGTQVWPEGSLFTECVNQWRVRVERKPNQIISSQEVYSCVSQLSEQLFVSSTEMLRNFNGKAGYSLAQGQ
ncbi:NADP-dependent isocitrate dehydrogenase [Cytophagales bacterium LB-30]|uniref:Isocitrate dehydrogenase [NADP] n=2 Tax=Shiella aurantiaca TaxID=3058365 RepID=A0ABT8F540_9BACT|nr:NADP-dependent isocitrate dehydrogenase [Shiella aurantiaca]